MNVYTKKPIGSTTSKQNFLWQKIITGIVVLFFLIGGLNIFQAPIKNTFYIITAPVSKIFWAAGGGVSSFFESFLNTKGLKQESDNLKEENQKLLSQIAILQETIKSDQATQSAIENTQHDNFALTLAGIIGQDADSDFILLDKGSDDGISENMPVISDTKVLYGKVFKVYKNYSQVMLISNKNSVVDAKISPRSGIPFAGQQSDIASPPILGVVKGSGNLSLYLDLISSDANLNQQDIIVTSGQEGIFPKDLLIGKIQNNNKNDLKPFQTAQVQPLFDIKNTENVFIITDYLK